MDAQNTQQNKLKKSIHINTRKKSTPHAKKSLAIIFKLWA